MKHGVECCPEWYGIHLLFSVFLRSQTCAPLTQNSGDATGFHLNRPSLVR